MNISNRFQDAWHSFSQTTIGKRLSPQLERTGAKLGIVKLTPEMRKQVDSLVNEAMKSLLNQNNINLSGVTKKEVQNVRADIRNTLTKAVSESVTEIAKKQNIIPARLSKQMVESESFQNRINKGFEDKIYKDLVINLLKQGSSTALREIAKDYEVLRQEKPSIDEISKQILAMKAKGNLSKADEDAMNAMRNRITAFDEKARVYSYKLERLSHEEKRELPSSMIRDSKEFLSVEQKMRTGGLVNFYHKILANDRHFEALKQAGQLDKNSKEWKEFTKDVSAFIEAMHRPTSQDFKKTNQKASREINIICDKWEIEFNK